MDLKLFTLLLVAFTTCIDAKLQHQAKSHHVQLKQHDDTPTHAHCEIYKKYYNIFVALHKMCSYCHEFMGDYDDFRNDCTANCLRNKHMKKCYKNIVFNDSVCKHTTDRVACLKRFKFSKQPVLMEDNVEDESILNFVDSLEG